MVINNAVSEGRDDLGQPDHIGMRRSVHPGNLDGEVTKLGDLIAPRGKGRGGHVQAPAQGEVAGDTYRQYNLSVYSGCAQPHTAVSKVMVWGLSLARAMP